MRTSLRACFSALGGSLLSLTILTGSSPADDESTGRGRELFERVWQPTHAPQPAADGLGPLFNERSCAACHSLGGIGGAGPNDKNVDLLTPSAAELRASGPEDRFRKVHPAFATVSTVVLHKYSTQADAYDEFHDQLLGINPQVSRDRRLRQRAERVIVRNGSNRVAKVKGVEFIVSRRNTTPLFGLGLVDRIPDVEINSVASQQSKRGLVSGRYMGRFGWRGQVKKLDSFVRSACATELGLNLATHRQPVNPLSLNDAFDKREDDISAQECRDLTAFVAHLPKPRRVLSDDRQQLVRIKNGEGLFDSVGCAECHRETLANVSGIYSDLLLHDMGAPLADPAPAPMGRILSSTGGYYEERIQLQNERLLTEARREWKTPPLWGLRDSGPYLHDGRAETVDEAIRLHGGEAEFAVHRYRELPSPQRQNLLAFLATLAVPPLITTPH